MVFRVRPRSGCTNKSPGCCGRPAFSSALTELGYFEIFAKFLELGPPVGKPVQYRISGPDPVQLRDYARDLAAVVAGDDRLRAVTLDWSEPARVARVVLDQEKLRQLGLTQTDVAQALYGLFDGVQAGRPLWRFNALWYADATLHQPRVEADPRPTSTPETQRYLRSELQSLYRLPDSRAVVFGIHTRVLARRDVLAQWGRENASQ